MTHVLLLTRRSVDALPALDLLGVRVTVLPLEAASIATSPDADVVVVDGATDLAHARAMCRVLETIGATVLLVVAEAGFAVVQHTWAVGDIVLETAGAAELGARIRMLEQRAAAADAPIVAAGLEIDESRYRASVDGTAIDLTYKEFELLRFLASHPSRVYSREQLLGEVWGEDYFGGVRTVDVHVRRLRAKLGDLDRAIGTVRGVGYRFELGQP